MACYRTVTPSCFVQTQILIPKEVHEILKRHCAAKGLKFRPFLTNVFIRLSERMQEKMA